ncbi:LacI family DNA-binding transcriptional regulator [Microbacterium murale]|uniref:LacI family transcriptional regulator n=1 Tax=Microbacterium murale TaxID=1081040 RepID=A0ABQ1S2Z2_9MICO|nr:LacI family DNA-binding transcriptional regulator [Microbacterium murale]GGD89043.1 LacI family transcriptional regulator [Microbacterium murale]
MSANRAKMEDVARHAGVSTKTVSRVLNQEAYVSVNTRERVQAAMRQLSYRPNPAAQGLRRSSSGSIAFVCEDISEPFAAQLALSVERAVGDRYVVIVASTLGDAAHERETLESLAAGHVDGIVLSPTPTPKSYFARLLRSTPIVCIDRPVRGHEADVVLSDNAGGMDAAVRHLIAAGHRHIAYLGDDEEVFTQRERLDGYRTALLEANIDPEPSLIYQHTPDARRVRQHLAWLRHLRTPPTAHVSGNSLTTLAMLHAGFNAASNSFVAFDDFPLADVIGGGINVVAQNAEALGAEAVHTVLRRIENDAAPVKTTRIGTRLLIRAPFQESSETPHGTLVDSKEDGVDEALAGEALGAAGASLDRRRIGGDRGRGTADPAGRGSGRQSTL